MLAIESAALKKPVFSGRRFFKYTLISDLSFSNSRQHEREYAAGGNQDINNETVWHVFPRDRQAFAIVPPDRL